MHTKCTEAKIMPSIHSPTSIFWPLDSKESGHAFGWANDAGSVTVAGVIRDSEDLETGEVLKLLESVNVAELGKVKLLGRCDFDKGMRVPSLQLVQIGEYNESSIVFYHRHQAKTLRFYSMDAFGLDMDAANGTGELKSSHGGISRDVVNQQA
ncbi:hypothetical protein BT96DRAFT_191750 [Gymnopus androsaceus JB14]|uniref:Uncharacterized protein n=1 Tax=Gymnopus androsaceus JB14 TaxID=1447944 RepID=A0A6A4IA49_9AGAR|nr:hypothetical protein BT96DRAFT_191750 [Gymnopus androsaceus JB14]